MAWPFTNVSAPNLDTGTGVAVPTSPTAITANQCWLIGAFFKNDHASNFTTVTVTDTTGDVVTKIDIPPGGEQPYEFPFRPLLGAKWSANNAGVLGHVWGYE